MAYNHTYGVAENSALVVSASQGVLTGIINPGQEQLEAILLVPPSRGAVVLNGDGSFTYTPEAGFVGAVTFAYNAYNGVAHSNAALVTLDVGGTTKPLVTKPGDQISTEGDTINLPIQASLPDNSVLIYAATGLPLGVSINAGTGLMSGTAESTFSQHGPYIVNVSVSDASFANTTSVSFTWTVDNLPPAVTGHAYAVAASTPLVVSPSIGALIGSIDPGQEVIQAVVEPAAGARCACAQYRRLIHLYADHGLHGH